MGMGIGVSRAAWAWARAAGLAWACLTGAAVAAPATPGALLTILDGQAQVITGARALAAVEGLRLPESTIVETSASSALLRLEFGDGSVVDLGPDTRAMVLPGALGRRGDRGPALYLLSGWAKLRSAPASPHRGLTTPSFEALPGQGTVVAYAAAEVGWLFAESGAATVVERGAAGSRPGVPAGSSYLRRGPAKGEVVARLDPELLKRLPRGFRDTIAPRAAQFAGKEVGARPLPSPDYAELRPWLAAEPALRRDFPRRFAPLLQDRTFRTALAAQLAAHPEWERTLYPERFVPPASAPQGASR